jgi:hypothetical protein
VGVSPYPWLALVLQQLVPPATSFGVWRDFGTLLPSALEILQVAQLRRIEEKIHMASRVVAAGEAVVAAQTPVWRGDGSAKNETLVSGMSWPAVFAGAFAAAALSLTLLALGTGLGFSAVSPWANTGASATAIGGGAIVWMILMQIVAWGLGGYLAGRLRTKWASIHTDEVYFRDTAHGFLVWAVGLVITAAFLASAAAAMMGGAARGGVNAAATTSGIPAAEGAGRATDPNAYFIDAMLRTTPSAVAASPTDANGAALANGNAPQNAAVNGVALHNEVALIFANALRQGNLSPEDKTYLGQVVAARTGISEPDAEQRVANAFTQIQQAADTARKTIAHTSLWIFLALLIGAFCASLAATFGGAQRDHVVVL